LAGLLAPAPTDCRFCRSPVHSGGNAYPPGLCAECRAAIPWIREIRCSVCGRYEECPDCVRREETFFVRNRSAVKYDDHMKAWLARYKYRGDERLAGLLADVLLNAYRLHQDAGCVGIAEKGPKLLTFVPLSDARREDRGFNQAEQMALMLGRRLKLPVVDLLKRNRHTEKQSLKSRGDRLKDMRDLFSLRESGIRELERLRVGGSEQPLHLYVVDDVYTTGSTLNECAKAIRLGLEARVYGLTLAR
jgi:competence protein ComFC